MKWNIKKLRSEVWTFLTDKEVEIHLINIKGTGEKGTAAYCTWEGEVFCVYVDFCECDVAYATVHEVFHQIFDPHFKKIATYNLYEYWIQSMEKIFFKNMNYKEKKKWYNMIRSKIVNNPEKERSE